MNEPKSSNKKFKRRSFLKIGGALGLTGANPKPGDKFLYVYHCHILEHEQNEMMRPYLVLG